MKTRFKISSVFALGLLTLGAHAFAQTSTTLAGDVRSLRLGDQVHISDDLALNETIPDRLTKEHKNFLSYFRMSNTLLECHGYTFSVIKYQGRRFSNPNIYLPKGTDLTITSIEHVDPKDSDRKNKNIASFGVTIEAESRETIRDDEGTTYHIKLICERDYMASKKFRHMPIEISDVTATLDNRLEFVTPAK